MKRWYLAEIVIGLTIVGWETGHNCYVRMAPDGRHVQVRGKGGIRAVVTVEEAQRRLRTVRGPDGKPVAVRDQSRWSNEWDRRAA